MFALHFIMNAIWGGFSWVGLVAIEISNGCSLCCLLPGGCSSSFIILYLRINASLYAGHQVSLPRQDLTLLTFVPFPIFPFPFDTHTHFQNRSINECISKREREREREGKGEGGQQREAASGGSWLNYSATPICQPTPIIHSAVGFKDIILQTLSMARIELKPARSPPFLTKLIENIYCYAYYIGLFPLSLSLSLSLPLSLRHHWIGSPWNHRRSTSESRRRASWTRWAATPRDARGRIYPGESSPFIWIIIQNVEILNRRYLIALRIRSVHCALCSRVDSY